MRYRHLFILLCLALPAVLDAAECGQKNGYTLDIFNRTVSPTTGDICPNAQFVCEPAQTQSVALQTADPFCDPNDGPCAVQYRLDFAFPANRENIQDAGGTSNAPLPKIYFWQASEVPDPDCWPSHPFSNCGAVLGCGFPGGPGWVQDEGYATITIGGVSCANVDSVSQQISVSVFTCETSFSCRERTDLNGLAFGGPSAALALGCPSPPRPGPARQRAVAHPQPPPALPL